MLLMLFELIEALCTNKNELFVTVEFVHQENIKMIGKGDGQFSKTVYNTELFGKE